MALVFRALVWLTTAFLIIGVVVTLSVYYLASRSLPDYDNVVSASGLTADVEMVRDNSGVPHIFPVSDRDAFFALGYAHAQDRLW